MREHLFELSVVELKNLFIHESKALIFALEAGVSWEDLKYVRDSLTDIMRYINARTPPSENYFWQKTNGENLPPSRFSDNREIDENPGSGQP